VLRVAVVYVLFIAIAAVVALGLLGFVVTCAHGPTPSFLSCSHSLTMIPFHTPVRRQADEDESGTIGLDELRGILQDDMSSGMYTVLYVCMRTTCQEVLVCMHVRGHV